MACKVCGRNSCASSFHSLKEQDAFEKAKELSLREIVELQERCNESEKLKALADELVEALQLSDRQISQDEKDACSIGGKVGLFYTYEELLQIEAALARWEEAKKRE